MIRFHCISWQKVVSKHLLQLLAYELKKMRPFLYNRKRLPKAPLLKWAELAVTASLLMQSLPPFVPPGNKSFKVLFTDNAHYMFAKADHKVYDDMTDGNSICVFVNYIFGKTVYFWFVNIVHLWYTLGM